MLTPAVSVQRRRPRVDGASEESGAQAPLAKTVLRSGNNVLALEEIACSVAHKECSRILLIREVMLIADRPV